MKLRFILCVVTLLWLLSGCSAASPAPYDPKDRVVLSKSLEDTGLTPSFDCNLLWSEVIVEASITTGGTVSSRPVQEEGFYGLALEERPQLTYTAFEASVLDVWQGEMPADTFTLHILGGLDSEVTKPRKNDRLVLFLKCVDGIYYLVDDEYSIFAVNPGGAMYAFGDTETFVCYDHDPVDSFKAAIQEKYNHIDEIYNDPAITPNIVRSIAREYLLEKGILVEQRQGPRQEEKP